MFIDHTKSAVANILASINDSNLTAFTEQDVTFGVPVALAEPDATGRNVHITLTGVVARGYKDAQTFVYTRLALDSNAVAADAPTEVEVLVADDQAAVVAKAAAALKLVDGEFTVTYTAPTDYATPGSLTLVALGDSLLYLGSRTITVVLVAQSLAALAPTTDLNGFVPA